MRIIDKSMRIIDKIKKNRNNIIWYFLFYGTYLLLMIIGNIKYLINKRLPGIDHVERCGYTLFLHEKDEGISKDLLIDPDRESLSQVILKELKEGETVLDIGANIGYYVLSEERIVGKRGKIIAIEPVKDNFDLLSKNIKFNKLSNVITVNCAIGEEDKLIDINISEKSNLHRIGGATNDTSDILRVDTVQCYKLDTFLKDNKINPNFIRMDVEGYEYEIIKGGINFIKNTNNLKIMMEVHPHLLGEEKAQELLKMMKKLGFESKIVVFENRFYPYAKKGSMIHKLLLNLFSRFTFTNRSFEEKLCRVHYDLKIESLLESKELFMSDCPHILFEKI